MADKKLSALTDADTPLAGDELIYVVQDGNSRKVATGSLYIPGGTDVAVSDGGTGASNASDARDNLGLTIGADVQAYSATLDAIAQVSPESYGLGLLEMPDAASAQVYLDLAPVAASGDYDDLDNKPTLGTMAAEDASNYTPTSGLAAVALSNDYTDLDNLPSLAPIATSGDFDDLTNVPTNVADLADLTPGTDGQVVGWQSGELATFTAPGSGDMLASMYDPNGVEADAFDSANHAYDNTGSGLSATNVQDAIDKIASVANSAVLFEAQTLNATQQAQVRANIGLGSAATQNDFATVAALLADNNDKIGYAGSGADTEVLPGDIITAQGFRYEVAASDAIDTYGAAHIDTAGGVRLRVLPRSNGEVWLEAFGVKDDGSEDASWALEKATSFYHCTLVNRGRFRLDSHVSVHPDGRRIIGIGSGITRFLVNNAVGGITLEGNNVAIEGFSVICDYGPGSGFGIRRLGSYHRCVDVRVDHGATDGSKKFIKGYEVPSGGTPWVGYYEDCLFSSTSEDCFYVNASSFNFNTFIGTSFRSAGRDGFRHQGTSSHGNIFVGCRAENNAGNGYQIEGRRGNHFVWQGGYIEHNGAIGIYYGAGSSDPEHYAEASYADGVTFWENGQAAVHAYKARYFEVRNPAVGAGEEGYYTNDAFRGAWGDFPFEAPQMVISGISRRGAATDYNLVTPSRRVLVLSGDKDNSGHAHGYAGIGPSVGVTRDHYLRPSGAYASHTVDLGKATVTAVIAGENIDLSDVSSSSALNAIIASNQADFGTSNIFRTTILSSQNVRPAKNATVVGGRTSSGPPSTANRKWQLDSETGNIDAAGAITGSASFTDYSEFFENLSLGAIPLGTIVALEGRKVRPAQVGDAILGVVSATGIVRAGDTPFTWQGRYLRGEFGEYIYEEIEDPEMGTILAPKENPDYDPTLENVPRSERPQEWTCVGLLGQLHVRVFEDIAAGSYVGPDGKVSAQETRLLCMEMRVPFDPNRGYGVAFCLLR